MNGNTTNSVTGNDDDLNRSGVDGQFGNSRALDEIIQIGKDLQSDVNQSQQGSLEPVSILAPVVAVAILSLLVLAAYRSWTSYRRKVPHVQQPGQSVARDPEQGVEHPGPLQECIVVDGRLFETKINQETEGKPQLKQNNRSDESIIETVVELDPTMEPAASSIPDVVRPQSEERADENNAKSIEAKDDALERPSTLKFLAASAAFQSSTLPALKRLPYTPDPDLLVSNTLVNPCTLPTIESESKDKVTPLSQAPRRMKPRGLLERRGSNVALTISLRPGEDGSNSNSSATNVTKSPKPIAYLQQASSILTVEELHQKSFDTSALQKEFWSIPMNHPSEKNFNIPGHGTKDRHRILPNEHSRVQLPQKPDDDHLSTYINANYIRDSADLRPPCSRASGKDNQLAPVTREEAGFIATQGPLTNTVDDFWRMIWQDNSASIVMLTKLKERKEQGAVETYGDIAVRVRNVKKHEHFTMRTMDVDCQGEKRELSHFWYTTWMDHETPEKTRGLLEMVQEVALWSKPTHGPKVVHCSAGIGRTGCYIAVHVGCQQLIKRAKADVLMIVSQMRLDRGGMVQTWEQYQFVHQALSRYGRILAGENVTTPSTAGSIRSPRGSGSRLINAKEGVDGGRPRTPKHQRSTPDTNLPTPKELKMNLKNAACNSRSEKSREDSKEKPRITLQRASDRLPPTSPLVIPCIGGSPNLQSPLNRMCLQTKDLNASDSPFSSFKFKWPSNQIVGDKVSSSAVHDSKDKNRMSPGRFRFSFTTVTVSPTVSNGGKKSPSRFCFDSPIKLHLTNGHCAESKKRATPRKNLSAKSASPNSAVSRTHFVFPSPGTL